MSEQAPYIILASASPRRQALLKTICPHFDVYPANIDESPKAGETAATLVRRLAIQKASLLLKRFEDALIIGSDTLIELDTKVLGKPANKSDFMAMMQALSDRQHNVLTAVALVTKQSSICELVSTQVEFAKIHPEQAESYWQSGEPQDKAGGYAIQGIGGQFVKGIVGSYSSVVGLPLYETKILLESYVKWT